MKPLSRRSRIDGERLGAVNWRNAQPQESALVAVGWGGSALILLQGLLSSFPKCFADVGSPGL